MSFDLTFAPLELPGRLMMSVLFLIPAAGLEIIAMGVTDKDLDSMTITKPKKCESAKIVILEF